MMAGLCKFTDIVDGTLDICDIADMNDILDVSEENQARIHEAIRSNHG